MGEIKRHFRDKGWSVRVPRRLQELSAKVNQATDVLTTQMQRSPKIEEVADYLGASVDEVLEAMESSSAYSSVPLEGTGSAENDDAPSIIDRYATDDKDLEHTDDRLMIEEALSELSPREREVIELRFPRGAHADRDGGAPGHLPGSGLAPSEAHAQEDPGPHRPDWFAGALMTRDEGRTPRQGMFAGRNEAVFGAALRVWK